MTVTAKLHPVAEAAAALAGQKFTISDMLNLAREEACRIEAVQKGLIDCGALNAPDAGQIRRRRIFDGMVRYFEREMRHA